MDVTHNSSWLDLLESSCSGDDTKFWQPPEIVVDDANRSMSSNSSREISIEFKDTENEKKFEKLVNEKKIKSPFKRHLSNEKLDENKLDYQDVKRAKQGENDLPKKRDRIDSSESSSTGGSSSFINREIETDRDILDRRQKQIDYGKNTIGYDLYVQSVPKEQRTREHPKTPPKHLKYSRRAWEGLIKSWRKKLHVFDPQSKLEPLSSKFGRIGCQDENEDQ